MESGTLKWFDESKGYVCVSRENGEEVLVPISAIQASGFKKLIAGETVQFDVVNGSPTEKMELPFAKHPVRKEIKAGEGATVGGITLHAIGRKLAIRGSLKSDSDLVTLIEERLPVASISALIEHGILEKEIYSVIVPRRTLQHRRARKEKLSREESDRAVRLARLAALNERVFGNREAGLHWLRSPKKRFHGRTPMAMMETEAGSRLVEEALYQIDEGMAA